MKRLERIFASPDSWWAALTDGGLMRYDAQRKTWSRTGVLNTASAAKQSPVPPRREGKAVPKRGARKAAAPKAGAPKESETTATGRQELNFVVNDMAFSETRWFAATEEGLLVSDDRGSVWRTLPLGPLPNLPVSSIRASRDARSLWVVSLRGLVFSSDAGLHWTWHDLPLNSGGALRLELAPGGREGQNLVAAAHNGLFISRDAGDSWQQAAAGLPGVSVNDFAVVGNVFVASPSVGGLYISTDAGRTWSRVRGALAEGVFPVIAADAGGAMILAASATDGIYAVGLDTGGATKAASESAAP